MRNIKEDWRVRKLIQLYESYFSPLKERARRDGVDYSLHPLTAIFDYERLSVWQVNEDLQRVLKGGSYFMLDGKYLIDLVSTKTFDEAFVHQRIIQNPTLGRYDYKKALIILNFGVEMPEWYPFEPEDDEEDCFDDEDCWDEDDFDGDDEYEAD
jgi:hypothetical protein